MSGALAPGAEVSFAPLVPFAHGASCIGRAHHSTGRNNQDGWAVAVGAGRTVGVVADGCGSQPRSELGAQLAAQYLAHHLLTAKWCETLPGEASRALLRALAGWVRELGGEADATVIERHFLFTFLAAVREGRRTLVFGMGDGAVVADGVVCRLDAGPSDAPDYCGYALARGVAPTPTVHLAGEVDQVVVMTDGLERPWAVAPGAVAGLWEDASGWSHRFVLQRRLNVLCESERVADDATLVVLGGG